MHLEPACAVLRTTTYKVR